METGRALGSNDNPETRLSVTDWEDARSLGTTGEWRGEGGGGEKGSRIAQADAGAKRFARGELMRAACSVQAWGSSRRAAAGWEVGGTSCESESVVWWYGANIGGQASSQDADDGTTRQGTLVGQGRWRWRSKANSASSLCLMLVTALS